MFLVRGLEIHRNFAHAMQSALRVLQSLRLPRSLRFQQRFTQRRACHAICTSRFTQRRARHAICTSRFTTCCACHEVCSSSAQSAAPATNPKCCACHEFCSSSAQSAAPATKPAAQSAAPATKSALPVHKVPLLPRNLLLEVLKVLPLPRNLQIHIAQRCQGGWQWQA